jgi:photosystem I P700 chlorophyll a apoprotein A1
MPAYPFYATDYPTVLCSFVHHMWIGAILLVGSSAHAAIHMVREGNNKYMGEYGIHSILAQREAIIGHLTWVTIFLGTHAFGIYIHNDTLQALGRPEEMITDNSIMMKPIFANTIWALRNQGSYQYINIVDSRVVGTWQELGTADFLIHHIHAPSNTKLPKL